MDVLLYGLGALSFIDPDGKKYENLTQAQYDNFIKYGGYFNELMAIAYRYNLGAPKWVDIYNKPEAYINELKVNYQLQAEGKAQVNSTIISSSGTATYTFLVPGGGTTYKETTDKAQFEAWNKAASLYNNCNSIAIKYGFNKPNWTDFEAGRGEQILKQYQERAAAKIAADEAEAKAIAEAAAAEAKAKAEAAAAAAKAKAEAAAAAAADLKQYPNQDANRAELSQDAKAQADAAFEAAQRELEEQQKNEQAAAEETQKINLTPVVAAAEPADNSVPWWGWAIAIVGGAGIVYALTRKKKKNRN